MSTAGIIAVNQLPLADAMKVFGRCCGSSAWAMQMARGRPYQDLTEMLRFADLKFRSLTRKDWLEAFIHIPDVVDIVKQHKEGLPAGAVPGPSGEDLGRLLERLERMLFRYQRKFGHKFIPLDDSASLETLVVEIQNRYRNDAQDEMERICNRRRRVSLHQLAALMSGYRPQEGDGVTIESSVTGEPLKEAAPDQSEDQKTAVPPKGEKELAR